MQNKKNDNDPILKNIRQKYKEDINRALNIGKNILLNGGSSQEAVIQTIVELENNELFNAGKGSSPTVEGKVEMDALIMNYDMSYGSIGNCKNVKNPILLAQSIKEKYNHKFLVGDQREKFNIQYTPDEYFKSEVKQKLYREIKLSIYGTVGCVAYDKSGRLCAGSSTGGTLNKEPGRIGDTPLPGIGTFINENGAITSTGHGEEFMKYGFASGVLYNTTFIMYDSMKNIMDRMKDKSGGCIGIDKNGKPQAYFNSNAMHYGYFIEGSENIIEFYRGLK